jgi:ABC-2 type transport system ATP-binding protein
VSALEEGPLLVEEGPLLEVRGIAKRYGEREALRGVDFEAHAGELVAVIGPNGAGKTTLLSILAGVQPPSAGTVSVAGSSAVEASGVGWGVGWVPQQPALYSRLSVLENLDLFARLERVADPRAVVRAMLEQTGLRERADERVGRLSGGNRQRVNIALGLLADPAVLVLDEPSSSLDPRQRERLWNFILGLSGRGRCVVFSSHNVAEAERYASRVIVLADGELLFSGSPAEFARAADTSAADTGSSGVEAGAGAGGLGFEGAFMEFLRERGH